MHDQLQQPMARQWRAGGMLVARAGFSAAALELAQRHGLLALRPQALEQQLIDFGPYLDRLIRDFEKTALFTAYVTQRAQPGAGDKSSEQPEATLDDLLAHGNAWAGGAGQRLWVLLGDYGTGKSAFVARLNYTLAAAARVDAAAPVPLAVNLRDIPNKSRLDDVLAEQWLRSTGQRLDPALLLYLLRRGRLVLLFDAFDEMGIASAGRPVVEQFRMLVGPSADGGDGAPRANRVLVTCREQFFKEHGEVQRATEGERVSALQGVALGLGGRIDLLLPFSAEQVQQFLTLRLGEAEARKASDFMQQHGLAELGDRPQLLEVIIASLPDLQAQGGAVSAGALYRAYTDRWLDDFKPAERQSSSAQLRQVLGVLAGLLWAREGNRMHYGDLYAMLRERPQLCEGLDPNQLDVELRTAAFLSRTPDGHYGFSHRSFLEFFLARRIDLSAQAQPPNQDLARLLDIPLLSTEVCGFVADLCVEDQRDALGTALKGVLAGATAAASKTSRINALWLGYRLALRDAATADRTAQACARYLPEAADLSACDLSGMALPGLALPGALLLGANLQGCALDQVRWAGADLRGSDLRNSTLFDADLRGAKLDEAIGNGCDLSLADMTHASARRSHWCGAMFMYARLAGTDFSGADLRGARLAAAKGAPMLDDALLAGATARDTGAVWPIALREPRPRALTAAAHAGGGASLAYSPDGTRLASASRDGVIRLWDASTGLAVAAWDGGGGIVHSVAFSPDGRQLASAAHDGLIRVWDTDSGAMTLTMSGHIGAVRSVMFSPTGQQLASAGQDGSVRLWSLADASFACFSGVHSGGVLSAVFSPHGQLLASIGRDEQVRLWKIPGGDLISTITRTPGWADASALAFSPDGLRLLTGSISGAQVWSVDTGKTLLTVGSATQITFAVAFSPSGKLFATGGSSEVRLWDAESGHAVGVLKSGGGWAGAMEFSPDGRQLAAATSAGDINVWDLAGARPAWHLQRWVAAVRSVAFGPDGLTLVSAGQDGSIRSWRADLGHLAASRVAHPEGITSIAFAPDGGCMASAGNDGTIKLWKRGAELPVATLRSEAVPIMNVMFSPDGSHLASVDGRSGLKVWDVSRGRVAMQIDADQSRAFDVGYSADGSRLASAGVSGVVRLWDVATGQEASKLSGNRGPVYSVAFSPDGRYMAVGGFDGWLRLFDADSEAQIGQFDGHDVAVLRVRFSPNGRYLASAGWDGRIRLWDVASCQLEATLTGHDGCVHSIAFSPDGKRLVSGGDDGIVRLWDVASARLLRWAHAADDGWYSVDLEADPRGLWRGEGLALRRLVYHDTSETMQPWPWVARRWCAEDVPELKAPDGPLSLAAAATPARKPRRAKARTG